MHLSPFTKSKIFQFILFISDFLFSIDFGSSFRGRLYITMLKTSIFEPGIVKGRQHARHKGRSPCYFRGVSSSGGETYHFRDQAFPE